MQIYFNIWVYKQVAKSKIPTGLSHIPSPPVCTHLYFRHLGVVFSLATKLRVLLPARVKKDARELDISFIPQPFY